VAGVAWSSLPKMVEDACFVPVCEKQEAAPLQAQEFQVFASLDRLCSLDCRTDLKIGLHWNTMEQVLPREDPSSFVFR